MSQGSEQQHTELSKSKGTNHKQLSLPSSTTQKAEQAKGAVHAAPESLVSVGHWGAEQGDVAVLAWNGHSSASAHEHVMSARSDSKSMGGCAKMPVLPPLQEYDE